jgi:hypothetical protein
MEISVDEEEPRRAIQRVRLTQPEDFYLCLWCLEEKTIHFKRSINDLQVTYMPPTHKQSGPFGSGVLMFALHYTV